jgi:hypothetical protein
MNNTNKILMMAVITSLLVIGTSLTPMQSFADRDKGDHEKTSDYKSKIFASSEEDKKSAKQHMDQDNECYRGDDCKQANQGQQVVGKDNDAKGFNDQSKNVQQAATPTPTTPTTPPKTCKECFTAFLDEAEETAFNTYLAGFPNVKNIEGYCGILLATDEQVIRTELTRELGLDEQTLDAIIECLIKIGILNPTPTDTA